MENNNYKPKSELIDILNRLELTQRDRLDLEYYIQNNKKGDNSMNSFGGSAITVLLPNDYSFELDAINPILIKNNKECFRVLKEQTEPILIFLKYLNANKPLSQVALRLRHLYSKGEGETYFAFGYPSTYSNEHIIGGLALASDMYAIFEDGTTKKIDYDGFDIYVNVINELLGSYNHSAINTEGATLPSTYLPRIYKENDDYYIESLFGSTQSGTNAECYYNKDTNKFVVKGGWTHPSFGPIEQDIVFDVDRNNLILTTVEETINIGGWANITGYTLTHM